MNKIGSFLLRWLRRLAFLVLGLFGISVIAALVVFFFPSILIQPRSLPWVAGALRGMHAPVEWHGGTWSAKSLSLFTKEISFSLDKPCFKQADPFTQVCLESVEATLSIDLRKQKLHVAFLNIPGGSAKVEVLETMGPEPLPDPNATPTPLAAMRAVRNAALSKITWDKVHIGKIHVDVLMPDMTVKGVVAADATSGDKRRDLKIDGDAQIKQKGKAKQHFYAHIGLGFPRGKALEYVISAKTDGPKPWLDVSTFGKAASNKKLEGTLEALLREPVQGIHEAGVKKCSYQWLEEEANFTLTCEVGIKPSIAKWTPISIQLNGALNLSDPKNMEALKVDAQTKVADFQNLVRSIRQTGWAVPAPFNQLGGQFGFNANLVAGASFQQPRVKFVVDSALDSKNQHLHFEGNGKLAMDDKTKESVFEADVLFTNTRLILPNISPAEMPRLVPDSSIVLSSKEVERKIAARDEKSNFKYKVTVRATKEHPIRLYSPQLREDVPVSLNLVIADSGMSGRIRVESFPVELFRRRAQIKKIDLLFVPDGATELSGRVDISYSAYDLKLAAFGTLEDPKFSITSNPPLSESSALSLLLFGRPLEELSTGEDESLGNAKAALANGAVSAMSMYLLASTPIESIGYDPTRGQFQATIRLMEGTTLQVSSTAQGPTGVGIRKRLTRNWVFNTSVERAPLSQERSVSTLLEWSKVY